MFPFALECYPHIALALHFLTCYRKYVPSGQRCKGSRLYHTPPPWGSFIHNTAHMLFVYQDPYLGFFSIAEADTAVKAQAEILTRPTDFTKDLMLDLEEVKKYAEAHNHKEFVLIK